MESTITTFDGNGQPDFLSLINAEVEKVEPAIMAPPSPPENQSIPLALPSCYRHLLTRQQKGSI